MKFQYFHYLIAVLALTAVASLYATELFLFLVLLFLAGMLLLVRWSLAELILFIACGLAGAGAEIFAITFGTWYYSTQHVFSIPFWLPVLWGIAAVFIKRIYEDISCFIKRISSSSS
ncbi:MAG: hypothetical protein ACQESE_03000 [Nanobdellota archaeon]